MEAYFKGELTTACAIYAPYRTGKSEFLYTCFRKTLNSGHLALYGNLEKYLKLVEDYDTEDFAEALEKIKIIWFEFNFESFNMFKTSLKTRFSIPKLLVEDNDIELTVKNETLANIMGEIKIELGALIIGAPKYEERRRTLKRARVFVSFFPQ